MLVPDPEVARRYGRSLRSLARWDEDEALGFPRPILIRGRKYRDLESLDAWDRLRRETSSIKFETAKQTPTKALC